MGAIIEVKYFNSFILSKVVNTANETATDAKPVWKYATNAQANPARNWYIEESRIRGGYNNVSVDYGAKAYLVENTNEASLLGNGIIYSGIYNSRTDVNNTNQFPVGESITRSIDPINGTVQKLYAEDTNLIIFQENKVSKALVDKDAIYSAEGGAITTSGAQVIGQIVSYAGNYGISRNPESFAFYGYRKYFVDKNRNAVLRLSRDGITEISAYGMKDFFRDNLVNLDTPNVRGKAIGGFDVHNKCYVVSLQSGNESIEYNTLSFDDSINGWTSFYTYKPSFSFNLKNKFYSTNQTGLFLHNFVNPTPNSKNRFYNIDFDSSVELVFNPQPSMAKVFKTINYEGSDGWKITSMQTSSDLGSIIYSRLEGTYDSATPTNTGVDAVIPPFYNSGFTRKENKYHAIIRNNTSITAGEVINATSMTGVRGYYNTVEIKTDNSTNLGATKELFAVSSNYMESSY
jgi:hypothetical protein